MKRKVKKAAPVGITAHDTKVYKKVRRRAHRLDLLFNVCGVRMGIASFVGMVPVIGPVSCIFFSLMVYRTALTVEGGLPVDIQAKMLFNIVIDFLIGLIPIVGDFIDIYYKANSRNLLLLEKHLVQVGEVNLGKRDHVDGMKAEDLRGILEKYGGYIGLSRKTTQNKIKEVAESFTLKDTLKTD